MLYQIQIEFENIDFNRNIYDYKIPPKMRHIKKMIRFKIYIYLRKLQEYIILNSKRSIDHEPENTPENQSVN